MVSLLIFYRGTSLSLILSISSKLNDFVLYLPYSAPSRMLKSEECNLVPISRWLSLLLQYVADLCDALPQPFLKCYI